MMEYLGNFMEEESSESPHIDRKENLRNVMYWATKRIDELYQERSEISDLNALAITEEFSEWIGDDIDPDLDVWTL